MKKIQYMFLAVCLMFTMTSCVFNNSPSKVVEKVMKSIKKGKVPNVDKYYFYRGINGEENERLKESIISDLEKTIEKYNDIDKDNKIKGIKIIKEKIEEYPDGKMADVKVELTTANGETRNVKFGLIKVSGDSWRIISDNLDGIIYFLRTR